MQITTLYIAKQLQERPMKVGDIEVMHSPLTNIDYRVRVMHIYSSKVDGNARIWTIKGKREVMKENTHVNEGRS